MKKLYVIGGAMGVGKTTVCQHLKRVLPDSVFLDGDWCWDADPFQVTEETKTMVLDNIRHLLKNFLTCPVYQNVIFCWVMDRQKIIDDVLHGLPTKEVDVKRISLICDRETLCQRLKKAIAAGVREEDILNRSCARLPLYEALDTVKIDTSGSTVAETVSQILEIR